MNEKTETAQTNEDSITILGTKVPTSTQMLAQRTLKFFADNPRVYSIVRANGKQPTQEEIEQQLCELEHVKELREDIKRNGGLIEPLIVRGGTLEVLEGNSRLEAYRQLAAKDALKWAMVKCTVLPTDVPDSLIFALLGQFHIKGKKDWAPYEQAGFLYRRFKDHNVPPKILSAELGLSTKMVTHLVETYEFMVQHDEVDISRWSYYDEYLKSNKIKKARTLYPGMDETIVDGIKTGVIERAMDLREQLPTVCASPVILKRFAEGIRTMPMEIDAESVLNTTLIRFRERVAFRTPVTDDDIDFLEKAMQAYAALKYNAKGKEGPMSGEPHGGCPATLTEFLSPSTLASGQIGIGAPAALAFSGASATYNL